MLRRLPHGHTLNVLPGCSSYHPRPHPQVRCHRVAVSFASSTEAPTIEVTPLVWADPTLIRALNGLRIFLERTASVPSLNRFLTAVQVLDIVLVPIDALLGP